MEDNRYHSLGANQYVSDYGETFTNILAAEHRLHLAIQHRHIFYGNSFSYQLGMTNLIPATD